MAYKKKYSGAQTLSNFLPDEVKKILKKRGFAELELLKNWGNIVPKKYISLIYPIKIKANSQKEGARLVLKVDPSIAFAVEHEKEKIIQKINSFFGYQAILKLELIQEKIQNKIYEIKKLSTETGAGDFFAPARKLFKKFGFKSCKPFAHYKEDPNSCYYNLEL